MALERLSVYEPKAYNQLNFGELFREVEAAVVPTIKESTSDTYIYNLSRTSFRPFGSRQIPKSAGTKWRHSLADNAKKFCRNTLRGMRASLSRVLSWAVACELD